MEKGSWKAMSHWHDRAQHEHSDDCVVFIDTDTFVVRTIASGLRTGCCLGKVEVLRSEQHASVGFSTLAVSS